MIEAESAGSRHQAELRLTQRRRSKANFGQRSHERAGGVVDAGL